MTTDTSAKYEGLGCEVVYGHKLRDEPGFFHIGSGSERRARDLAKRSSLWRAFVNAHGGTTQVEVEIIERHHCPARARLREMELVKLHQPPTNVFGRLAIPEAVLAGHPKGARERCRCSARDCYGAEMAGTQAGLRDNDRA